MKPDLANRSVALIAPAYYRYADHIRGVLAGAGASVRLFPERPFAYATVARFAPWCARAYAALYCGLLERGLRRFPWDTLLVIRGQILTPGWVRAVRRRNPDARCIMYQWDSVANNDYRPLLDAFDDVMTFDPDDAERLPGVRYLPLFAVDDYRGTTADAGTPQDIDLLFVGVLQGDRLEVLRKLAAAARQEGLVCHFHVYATRWTRIRNLSNPAFRVPYVSSRSLQEREIVSLMARSRVVVDIENPGQRGLTMRTIEALAAGKRLLTTNRRIEREPFYDSAVISVIDRDDPAADPAFVRKGGGHADMDAYGIENWVRTLFGRAEGPDV